MIEVSLRDGRGTSNEAKITERGQLVTAPLDFSTAYNATADVVDTAYNLVPPKADQQFVITTIILYANKNVGATDATVVLYEALSASSTTVSKTVLNQEIVKQTRLIIPNANIIVSEGYWLNVKTNDDDVFATVLGYYVDAVS